MEHDPRPLNAEARRLAIVDRVIVSSAATTGVVVTIGILFVGRF